MRVVSFTFLQVNPRKSSNRYSLEKRLLVLRKLLGEKKAIAPDEDQIPPLIRGPLARWLSYTDSQAVIHQGSTQRPSVGKMCTVLEQQTCGHADTRTRATYVAHETFKELTHFENNTQLQGESLLSTQLCCGQSAVSMQPVVVFRVHKNRIDLTVSRF